MTLSSFFRSTEWFGNVTGEEVPFPQIPSSEFPWNLPDWKTPSLRSEVTPFSWSYLCSLPPSFFSLGYFFFDPFSGCVFSPTILRSETDFIRSADPILLIVFPSPFSSPDFFHRLFVTAPPKENRLSTDLTPVISPSFFSHNDFAERRFFFFVSQRFFNKREPQSDVLPALFSCLAIQTSPTFTLPSEAFHFFSVSPPRSCIREPFFFFRIL